MNPPPRHPLSALVAPIDGHPRLSLGAAAAAGPEPSDGDPLFQQSNVAIAPYSTERQKMDWLLVMRVASALAAQRCDLKVYGYLGFAVFQNPNAEDSPYLPLAAVLHALGDLIEQGWPRCLPKSNTRRQAQLKWFSEELSAYVKSKPPRDSDQPVLAACSGAATRAAEIAGSALELGYPLLRELREALKEHERAMPAPPPAPAAAAAVAALPSAAASAVAASPVARPPTAEPTPGPSSSPAPVAAAAPTVAAVPTVAAAPVVAAPTVAAAPPPAAATPSSAPPVSHVSVDVAQLPREALEDQLASFTTQLAAQLRGDSPTEPAPYWLLRALRWASHDLLRPDRVADVLANKGRSQIPLPQGHARLSKDFPHRLAAGQYSEVVAECEELFAMSPLWLDLQRFIATGLEALGASAAGSAVKLQAGLLLQCCPRLVEIRFSDRDATRLPMPRRYGGWKGWAAGAAALRPIPRRRLRRNSFPMACSPEWSSCRSRSPR